jgi:hypothetical protein
MTIEKYKASQFSQRFNREIQNIIIGWSLYGKCITLSLQI